ncbi:SGNH/GDSL hydrolase family protein [Kistimonas asteriae]|uniref:SGNH/GDSL hydrolase family protein n=1 Tax=Kistimonas asteriae TaxID=517724 RepID=UPI001BA977D3|nr:SGNH/GDSL hydrolase family protein [Kistimonas asteriae]
MIIRATFALFLCLFVSIITTPTPYAATINRLVIFGDSLSDQGRLYEFFHDKVPVSPPYWYGRFSNGPVWTDIISERYPIKNLSEGGATLVNYATYSLAIKYLYITYLGEEITHFLKQDAFRPSDLVIIWMGGNDYIAYDWLSQNDMERAVRELYLQVLRLRLKGAQQVLVINLPDMSQTPLAKQEKDAGRLHLLTISHNQLLEETLLSILPSDFIQIYDAYSVFEDILTFPDEYGLHDATTPCYTGRMWRNRTIPSEATAPVRESILSANRKVSNVAAPIHHPRNSPQCEGLLFFDNLHPTTFAHGIIADKLDQFIQENY